MTDMTSTAGAADSAPVAGTRVVSPVPRDVWRRVLAADPAAFATQKPEWLDGLCAARGYVDASRLYELPDGRALVLPMAGRVWGGVRVAEESWPYGWGYGGVLAEGGRVSSADAAVVLADLARRPVTRASIVPMPLSASVWATAAAAQRVQRVPYLTQVIDLDGGFDAVWSHRFKKATRNTVRKARRMPVEIRRDHGGDVLNTFAEMYGRSTERWARLRGQPVVVARALARYRDRAGQLAAVSATMGESCVIWSALRAREPVAVLVVLQHGQHSMSWLTAIDRELARETLATYLLQSLAIEDACRVGARWFHMGETDAGSGVELYKTKFGAAPVEYEALRVERLPITRAERRIRRAVHTMSERRARWRALAAADNRPAQDAPPT